MIVCYYGHSGCRYGHPAMKNEPRPWRLMAVGQHGLPTRVPPARWAILRTLDTWLRRAGFRPGAAWRLHFTNVSYGAHDLGPRPGDLAWLAEQVAIVRPQLVLALGRVASEALIGETVKIERDVGAIGLGATGWYQPMVMILPHPSGRNRLLNNQPFCAKLDLALATLSELRRDLNLDEKEVRDAR